MRLVVFFEPYFRFHPVKQKGSPLQKCFKTACKFPKGCETKLIWGKWQFSWSYMSSALISSFCFGGFSRAWSASEHMLQCRLLDASLAVAYGTSTNSLGGYPSRVCFTCVSLFHLVPSAGYSLNVLEIVCDLPFAVQLGKLPSMSCGVHNAWVTGSALQTP